jgi:hypothetical protein
MALALCGKSDKKIIFSRQLVKKKRKNNRWIRILCTLEPFHRRLSFIRIKRTIMTAKLVRISKPMRCMRRKRKLKIFPLAFGLNRL